MIDDFSVETTTGTLHRMTKPVRPVGKDLLRRGLSAAAKDEAILALENLSYVADLESILDQPFEPFQAGKFSVGRFGDGTFGVFYSAFEPETAIEEMFFYFKNQLAEDQLSRHYWLIECDFIGSIANLVGQEATHAELISIDNSGYPFCQDVARSAKSRGIDGLKTRSARRANGVCAPVFTRACLSNAVRSQDVRFESKGGVVQPPNLSPPSQPAV